MSVSNQCELLAFAKKTQGEPIRIWDMARLPHESRPNEASRAYHRFEFSEDLKQLNSERSTGDGKLIITVRTTSAGSIDKQLELDCRKRRLVALSRDRRFFARTSDNNDTTEIVESDSGVIKQTLIYPGIDTKSGKFSKDSNFLALSSHEGDQIYINIWSTVTGQLLRSFANDYSLTDYAEFSSDSRCFAVVYNGEIKIFDNDAAPGTSPVKVALVDWEYMPGVLAFSHDSKLLATAKTYEDYPIYRIQIWNISTMTLRETIYVDNPVRSLSFSFDASFLVTDLNCIAIQTDESDDRDGGEKVAMDPKYLGFYLSSDFSWIEFQGKKMIYIPGEYRRNDNFSAVSRRNFPTAVTTIATCYDPEKCWLMELAETEPSYV
jgi:hypothetical protein